MHLQLFFVVLGGFGTFSENGGHVCSYCVWGVASFARDACFARHQQFRRQQLNTQTGRLNPTVVTWGLGLEFLPSPPLQECATSRESTPPPTPALASCRSTTCGWWPVWRSASWPRRRGVCLATVQVCAAAEHAPSFKALGGTRFSDNGSDDGSEFKAHASTRLGSLVLSFGYVLGRSLLRAVLQVRASNSPNRRRQLTLMCVCVCVCSATVQGAGSSTPWWLWTTATTTARRAPSSNTAPGASCIYTNPHPYKHP